MSIAHINCIGSMLTVWRACCRCGTEQTTRVSHQKRRGCIVFPPRESSGQREHGREATAGCGMEEEVAGEGQQAGRNPPWKASNEKGALWQSEAEAYSAGPQLKP